MADQLQQGVVESAEDLLAGDELVADAPVGATTLVVEDAVDFAEDGGTLTIGTEVLTYTSADMDTDTLTLSTPTTVAYLAEEPVYVSPEARERTATVRLDVDGEAVEARVPYALYDRVPEGIRDPGMVEHVALYRDGTTWVIDDVLGQAPLVDAAYIDPQTVDVTAWGGATTGDTDALSTRIDTAVSDFQAGLATKARNTDSPDPPGATENNLGDTWRQHAAGDPSKWIAQWRGLGGTSWQRLDLDTVMIPQVHIGTGTFGDLDGGRILAETIGVEKLLVADFTDYIRDPYLTNPANWYISSPDVATWSFATVGGASPDGTYTVIRARTTGVAGNSWAGQWVGNSFPVRPGEQFHVRAYSRRQQVTAASGEVRVGIWYYAEDGTYITAHYYSRAMASYTTTAWWQHEGSSTVPAGAAEARCLLYLANVPATEAVLWDFTDFHVRRKSEGSLIVDGAIDGKKISGASIYGGLYSSKDSTTARRIEISDDLPDGGLGGSVRFSTGVAGQSSGYVQLEALTATSAEVAMGSPGLTTRRTIVAAYNGTGGSRDVALKADSVYVGRETWDTGNLYVKSLEGSTSSAIQTQSTGRIIRSSSSLRYKTDVQPLTVDVDAVLALDPILYRRLPLDGEDRDPTLYPGFLAEDAARLGLHHWVAPDTAGRPDGFRYAEWVVALHTVARHQAQQIDALTTRVALLEGTTP